MMDGLMMHDMLWFFLNQYDDAYMDAWVEFAFFNFSFILISEQGKQGL